VSRLRRELAWLVLGPVISFAALILGPGKPPYWLVISFIAVMLSAAEVGSHRFEAWWVARRARRKGPL